MKAMDIRDLERAVSLAIIDCLADRVVETLQARRTAALALFTGTDIGLRQAETSIRTLRDVGWTFRMVLSAGARKVLTAKRLRAFGASPAPDASSDVDALLDGCGLLLVPTLSITTAAKVACGIRDSLASRLLARALERGVAVLAASDGCCPDNPERTANGFLVTDAYKARLRSNLEVLQSYGIRLVRAGDLAAAARGAPARAAPAAPPASAASAAGKRIFSRSDAMRCRDGELRLGRDVLVTSLAADELRIRNVRLIQA